MFNSYLKITFRNIYRNPVYSIINILGLAIGMACFIIIMIWVKGELSYDKFHEHKDQTYRIVNKKPTATDSYAGTPAPLGQLLIDNFPDILYFTRLSRSELIVRNNNNNKVFNESQFYFVDPSFFKIFTFQFLTGNPETALKEPNSIVITESIAYKYFNKSDPIGEVLSLENGFDFYHIYFGVEKRFNKYFLWHSSAF